MGEVTLEMTIQSDSEGYVTFECPYCESQFKLSVDECQNEADIYENFYCPYCGLMGDRNNFYTKEAIQEIQNRIYNLMTQTVNKELNKMSRQLKKSKFLSIKVNKLKEVATNEIVDKDTVEEVFQCSLCGKHEKVIYCLGVSKIYCAYCGSDL